MSRRLQQLCRTVRAISPQVRVIFHAVPDHEDAWVIRVMAADLILVETAAGEIDKALAEALGGMNKLSERVRAQLLQPEDEERPSSVPPPGTPTPRA